MAMNRMQVIYQKQVLDVWAVANDRGAQVIKTFHISVCRDDIDVSD
jgi:hypothetical protein